MENHAVCFAFLWPDLSIVLFCFFSGQGGSLDLFPPHENCLKLQTKGLLSSSPDALFSSNDSSTGIFDVPHHVRTLIFSARRSVRYFHTQAAWQQGNGDRWEIFGGHHLGGPLNISWQAHPYKGGLGVAAQWSQGCDGSWQNFSVVCTSLVSTSLPVRNSQHILIWQLVPKWRKGDHITCFPNRQQRVPVATAWARPARAPWASPGAAWAMSTRGPVVRVIGPAVAVATRVAARPILLPPHVTRS